MIRYAGVKLADPSPDIVAWARANIDPSWIHGYALRTWPPADVTALGFRGFIPPPPVTLGTLYWPWGAARFAVGYFLATSDQLALIQAQNQPASLVLSDGVGGVITAQMFTLPSRPLTGAGDPFLWLLTLVDQRFYWWMRGTANISTRGDAWDDLYEAIEDVLGVTITVDAVPEDYLTPPSTLDYTGSALPLYLDAVCAQTGMRLVCTLDGTVEVISATSSGNRIDANHVAFGGGTVAGDLFETLERAVPQSVGVSFPGGSALKTLASLNLSEFAGVTGYVGTRTLLTLIPPDAGDPTGDALSSQIAGDWYRWHSINADTVFQGIVNLIVEAHTEAILWDHSSDTIVTRLIPAGWLDYAQEVVSLVASQGDVTNVCPIFIDDGYPDPATLPGGGVLYVGAGGVVTSTGTPADGQILLGSGGVPIFRAASGDATIAADGTITTAGGSGTVGG